MIVLDMTRLQSGFELLRRCNRLTRLGGRPDRCLSSELSCRRKGRFHAFCRLHADRAPACACTLIASNAPPQAVR